MMTKTGTSNPDSFDRIVRKGQPGRIARTEPPGQDSQDRTAETGHLGQNSIGQNSWERIAREDSRNSIARA